MSNEPFLGLTGPVFTAFGWAGQEQAVQYALGQLSQFVQQTHARMARETQTLLPHHGKIAATQGVYMARSLEIQNDLYITFHARPMAFRMAIALEDRIALMRALKAIEKNTDGWYNALQELDAGWELRFQQMEHNPETGESAHYKDVFKDSVSALTASESASLIDRMAYLNSEEKWFAPITLSRRMSADFVSAMSTAVTTEIATELDGMLPVLRFLTGGVKAPSKSRKTAAKATKKRAVAKSKPTKASALAAPEVNSFTYVATLKPLHIRKGFVNLTEAHWPFFAINSRTETREVTLKFEGNVDRKSAVWRLMPSEKARLVLGDAPRDWIEENFQSNDEVQVTVTRVGGTQIEVLLEMVK